MSRPIHIFGAGGLGREVNALIARLPEWHVAGFFDDGVPRSTRIDGISCMGSTDDLLSKPEKLALVIAVGDPVTKHSIVDRLRGARHLEFPVLIDPSAFLLDRLRTRLGAGSIVTAGAVLTTGISIGAHCLINLNVTIGHDTRMGEACSVMPGANLAGNVSMGSGVLVGSGANILNGVSIGDNARIGAGAVVLHSVAAHTTVMGVPAKEKR